MRKVLRKDREYCSKSLMSLRQCWVQLLHFFTICTMSEKIENKKATATLPKKTVANLFVTIN